MKLKRNPSIWFGRWGYHGDEVGITRNFYNFDPDSTRHELQAEGTNLSLKIGDDVVSSVQLEDKYIQDARYDEATRSIILKLDDTDIKSVDMGEFIDSEFESLSKEEIYKLYINAKSQQS